MVCLRASTCRWIAVGLGVIEVLEPWSRPRQSLPDLVFPAGYCWMWSGSRVMLPPPRPLRTARTGFPVSSSSLSNALLGTRLCHVYPVAMDVLVTVGVQQHPIGRAV